MLNSLFKVFSSILRTIIKGMPRRLEGLRRILLGFIIRRIEEWRGKRFGGISGLILWRGSFRSRLSSLKYLPNLRLEFLLGTSMILSIKCGNRLISKRNFSSKRKSKVPPPQPRPNSQTPKFQLTYSKTSSIP